MVVPNLMVHLRRLQMMMQPQRRLLLMVQKLMILKLPVMILSPLSELQINETKKLTLDHKFSFLRVE